MKTFTCCIIGISFNDGFIVEVADEINQYSAWIYHKDYGIKILMFAVDKQTTTLQDFLDMAKGSYPEYAEELQACICGGINNDF